MPTVNRTAPNERHVQSLVFDKENWTYEQAKNWAERNGYYVDGYDETEQSHRFRQYDPEQDRFDYAYEDVENEKGLTKNMGYPKDNSGNTDNRQSTHRMAETVLRMAEGQPWAIQPAVLEKIFEIAERRNDDIEAVQRELGRPLANAERTTVRETPNGSVAVIPISGPIFRHANLFTEISGASSIDMMAGDFARSLDDPQISGIILEVDSPGGTVAGVQEFAQQIYEARGTKPIAAWVDYTAASAAYWIASAAPHVAMIGTSSVGSIGVIGTVPRKEDGKYEREFISSTSPNKNPDPDTDEGARLIQERVDAMAEVFIADVAKHRGVSEETVRNKFGRGDLLLGTTAVQAGMADEITTFEALLNKIGSQQTNASERGAETKTEESEMGLLSKLGFKAKDQETEEQAEARLERLNTAFPESNEFALEQFKEGKDVAEGVQAAIEKAKEDAKSSDEESQKTIQAKDKEIADLRTERDQLKSERDQAVSDRDSYKQRAEKAENDVKDRENRTPVTTGNNNAEGSEDELKTEYNADENLQAEFPSAEAYASYMKRHPEERQNQNG